MITFALLIHLLSQHIIEWMYNLYEYTAYAFLSVNVCFMVSISGFSHRKLCRFLGKMCCESNYGLQFTCAIKQTHIIFHVFIIQLAANEPIIWPLSSTLIFFSKQLPSVGLIVDLM